MAKNIQVAIAETFWEQSVHLPNQQRKKLPGFISRFRQEPTSPGFNYEKINDARVANYRSVRLDQAYRCIVLAPEKGDLYCLLWVDHHDDAYQWARTNCVEINKTTGAIQIYNTQYLDGPPPVEHDSVSQFTPPPVTQATLEPIEETPLFNLDDTRLLKIGVPESMLQTVMDLVSETQLQKLKDALPIEAFEALEFFAGGIPWEDVIDEYGVENTEPVDTEDFATAMELDTSKRRFHIVESDEELQQILAAPLEKWRVYLHPSQRKLVTNQWNGPVRVTGGAGTGKTVVAMHRAVWLVENTLEENGKVLFLTYNTNLAGDIAENLRKITTPEQFDQIEIINIDAWATRFLKSLNYTSRIVNDSQLAEMWSDVIDSCGPIPGKPLPASFFTEEWTRVILPKRINSRQEYLKVSRVGRGVALSRPQRAAIWEYFDEMRSQLQRKGWRTWQDAMLDAKDLIVERESTLPYQHVVVDEAQDMGQEALQLIRALVPQAKNDLFLVGDGNQRIYPRRAVMGQCGINIKGRGRKLKINYRTTEQIRRFATAFMAGQPVDDLDDNPETTNDYKSLTYGPDPELKGFETIEAEVEWIVKTVKNMTQNGQSLSDCCVLLRIKWLRNKYAQALKDSGLEAVTLDAKNDNRSIDGIRIANMHRIKGLEFRHVFLAGMSEGTVPFKKAVEGSEDPTELRDYELGERALIHVASSRAIETLSVTWHGEPSSYLAG
jgi:superfamily I DNA/RNA helicase